MNIHKFLEKLFDGYVTSYRKFGWHKTSTYSDMTQIELNHFSILGESLGYISSRETHWEYPRDLCWIEPQTQKTFLYMERENKYERYAHTIDKMLNPLNTNNIPVLVAVFGWLKQETYDQAKQEISNRLPEQKAMLLIAWIAESQDSENFIVRAFCKSSTGLTERSAIPSLDNGGYWQLNFEDNSTWR